MIDQTKIPELLLKACPSFKKAWEAHLEEYGEELIYVAMGDFARHLLALYKEKQIDEFQDIGKLIERLHVEGTPSTKEIATIGILEAIQNVWGNEETDPELLRPYLGTESNWYWQSLNDFWEGKVPYVGYKG